MSRHRPTSIKNTQKSKMKNKNWKYLFEMLLLYVNTFQANHNVSKIVPLLPEENRGAAGIKNFGMLMLSFVTAFESCWVGEKKFKKVLFRKLFAWSFFSVNFENDLENENFFTGGCKQSKF